MKIKKQTMLIYVAAIAFVLSSSAYIKSISNIFSMVINITELIVMCGCLLGLKKNTHRNIVWIVIGFYLTLAISTVFGTREFGSLIVYSVQGIGAVAFVSYYMFYNPKGLIRIIRNCLILVVGINLIQMLFFSGTVSGTGNTANYFLGLRVAFTPFIVTMIFFSVLYDIIGYKKTSVVTRMSIIMGVMTVFLKNVSTGLVVLSVIALVYFGLKYNIIRFRLLYFYVVFMIVYVAVVGFNIQYHIPLFSYFLEGVLGKDLSFDNRTTIWFATIAEIIKQPWIGYGISGGGNVLVQFQYRIATLSAHTQFLETLHQGGVVAFAFFIMMFLHIDKEVRRIRNSKLANLSIAFVTGFVIMMFTEVQMTKALIFLLLATVSNLSQLNLLEEY